MSQAPSELLNTNQTETATGKLLRHVKERIDAEMPKKDNNETSTKEGVLDQLITDAVRNARQRMFNSGNISKAREGAVKFTKSIPKKIIHDNMPKPAPQNYVSKVNVDEQADACVATYNLLFNPNTPGYYSSWDRKRFRNALDILNKTISCVSRLCYSWGWQIFKGNNISFEDSKLIKRCDIQKNYMTPILRHTIMTRTVAGSMQWRLKILIQFIDGKYHDAPNHNTIIHEYYEGAIITAMSLVKDLKQIGDLIRNDPDGPCFIAYMNKEEGYDHITKIINNLKKVVNGLSAHLEKVPLPFTGF